MAETKIKVAKDGLIEAIKARKAEAQQEHEAACIRFDQGLAVLRDKQIARFEKALENLRNGGDPTQIGVSAERVEDFFYGRPKFDTTSYDRHIHMLELSPEETVSVSTTDFGAYLR